MIRCTWHFHQECATTAESCRSECHCLHDTPHHTFVFTAKRLRAPRLCKGQKIFWLDEPSVNHHPSLANFNQSEQRANTTNYLNTSRQRWAVEDCCCLWDESMRSNYIFTKNKTTNQKKMSINQQSLLKCPFLIERWDSADKIWTISHIFWVPRMVQLFRDYILKWVVVLSETIIIEFTKCADFYFLSSSHLKPAFLRGHVGSISWVSVGYSP